MSNISRKAHRLVLKAKKSSPKILFVAGIVGFGATIYSASKAAIKANDIRKDAILTVEEGGEVETRDLVVGYAKAYAPTVVTGVITVACLTKSHNMLTARNVALVASFTGLDKAFSAYRERVKDSYGDEIDRDMAHGVKEYDLIKYDETGNSVIERVKRPDISSDTIYIRFFDETNRNWIKDMGYNCAYLSNQQTYFNLELRAKGYLFLNDVLEALGFERTPEGQVVGWLYNDSHAADEYVDFGFNKWPDFVAGYERSVKLEFNCDGDILNLI